MGVLSALAIVTGLVAFISTNVGPAPEAADVCREVPGRKLDEPIGVGVRLAAACQDIDVTLELPLGGTDGFEGVASAPAPPSSPGIVRPVYLDWTTDGCSAPVLGAGPFDFTLPCERHDFGWRNLKLVDEPDAPIWHVGNKDRVDAGFLYDMRLDCSALSPIWRIGCDTTARVYYTAIRLNPAGAQGLPGRR